MLAWAFILVLFAGVSAKSSRIVGGENTTIENFPSIVQIDSLNDDTEVWQQYCGGSILTSRHVLSSGTCLSSGYYDPREQRVRAGASYRNTGGVVHYFDRVIVHPTNIVNNYINNIGIARLATSLVFTPAVQRTAIPSQGSVIPDGLPVTQVGWGRTQFMGEHSDVLRYVDVLTVNFELCRERYNPVTDWPTLGSELICSGRLNEDGKGTCFGDYGGPLLYGNVTIGVIHGQEGCGNSTYPSLNVNVAQFTDWIVANAV